VSEWRTIESAPKDGTPFMVFSKSTGFSLCAYVWDNFRILATTDPVARAYDYEGNEEFSYSPRHWQPLPAPPVEPTPQ
jgi:hypothetical protein